MASNMEKTKPSGNINSQKYRDSRRRRVRSRYGSSQLFDNQEKESDRRRSKSPTAKRVCISQVNQSREARRPVLNGPPSFPRHNVNGRGFQIPNSALSMGPGPPCNQRQLFRFPLPMTNPHFMHATTTPRPPTFDGSNTSAFNRQHRFPRNQSYFQYGCNFRHPFNHQVPMIHEDIPANHVRFQSHSYGSVPYFNRFNSRQRGYKGGFSDQYIRRPLPLKQARAYGKASLRNDRRIGWTGRKGHHPTPYLSRRQTGVSAPPKLLRWRNNYKDLQRNIRNYFRTSSRDPLGLEDICRENSRRDNLGLTPLRGDSAVNTPVYSLSTPNPNRDMDGFSGFSMIPGRNEVTPRTTCSGGVGAADHSQEHEENLDLNDSVQRSGLESLDRHPSDVNSIDNIQQNAPGIDEQQSPAQRQPLRSQLQSRDDGPRYSTPASRNGPVRNDRFHRQNYSIAYMNSHGDRRFMEQTIHGNYHNYYTRRRVSLDLSVFRQYVESREVLDIGCNSGLITIMLAKLAPSSITGIDIDGRLIQEAKRTLFREKKAEENRRKADDNSHVQNVGYFQHVRHGPDYLCNVDFQTGDYVPSDSRSFEPQYDTIFALSVTKWIHLVSGDSGLNRFFKRAYEELREGGFFLVEPQPWKSYRKSFRKDHHHNPNTLNEHPPFHESILRTGFSYECSHEAVRPNSDQFRDRKIFVYKKSGPEAISTSNLGAYPQPPPLFYYSSPDARNLQSTRPSTSFNIPGTPSHASPTGSYINEAPGPSHPAQSSVDMSPSNPMAMYSPISPSYSHISPHWFQNDASRDPANEDYRPAPYPGPSQSVNGYPYYSDDEYSNEDIHLERPVSLSDETSTHREPTDAEEDLEVSASSCSASCSSSGEGSSRNSIADDQRPSEQTSQYVPLNFVFPPPSRQSSVDDGGASEASTSDRSSWPKHRPLKMKFRRLGNINGQVNWTVDEGLNFFNDQDADEDLEEDDDLDDDEDDDDLEEEEDDDLEEEEEEDLDEEEENMEEENCLNNIDDGVDDNNGAENEIESFRLNSEITVNDVHVDRSTDRCPLAYNHSSGDESFESGCHHYDDLGWT